MCYSSSFEIHEKGIRTYIEKHHYNTCEA
ncbi:MULTISPECIES: hypothetical protein [Pseudomonadota]|nr:hypothetical protein CJJ19_01150 [Candidatus Hamiltonella defensa]